MSGNPLALPGGRFAPPWTPKTRASPWTRQGCCRPWTPTQPRGISPYAGPYPSQGGLAPWTPRRAVVTPAP